MSLFFILCGWILSGQTSYVFFTILRPGFLAIPLDDYFLLPSLLERGDQCPLLAAEALSLKQRPHHCIGCWLMPSCQCLYVFAWGEARLGNWPSSPLEPSHPTNSLQPKTDRRWYRSTPAPPLPGGRTLQYGRYTDPVFSAGLNYLHLSPCLRLGFWGLPDTRHSQIAGIN